MKQIQILIISLALTWSISSVSAQCGIGSFNCNDTIQVSVDEMCEAIITADMVLEQPNLQCVYNLVFFDKDENELNIPNNKLTANHVGQLLKVRVEEANVNNPNSCWGYIRVEDKINETIICAEFDPFKCTDTILLDLATRDDALKELIRRELIMGGITDNCLNIRDFDLDRISIIKNEAPKSLLCRGEFSAQSEIEYDIIGLDGRVIISCSDTIVYEKIDPDEVQDPMDFTGDDALECDGTWKNGQVWEVPGSDSVELVKYGLCVYPNFRELFMLDPASFPNIDGEPVVKYDEREDAFVKVGLCNINAAFTDLPPFEICGKSYKLIRTWTIIDWCSNATPKSVNQIIEVKDTKAPVFSVEDVPSADAGSNTCEMVIDLPEPEVSEECNNWFYCVEFKYPGLDSYESAAKYRNLDPDDLLDPKVFPIGITSVRYIVKDECLNQDTTEIDVEVNDGQAPIAICDTRTVVMLNNNNRGKIFPPTVDDKSFDNCTDDLEFKIWRKDGRVELIAPDSSFVKFDGDDIDKDIRVMMQVTDEGGMKNSCWTTIEVKANVDGPILSNPGPLDFCTEFTGFQPESDGFIALNAESDTTGYKEARIIVLWLDTVNIIDSIRITDTIYFVDQNPISASNVALPQDIQLTVCDDLQPSPADLANILDPASYPQTAILFDDVIFSEKIFRNWTVIDLCTNVEIITHTQIIEIVQTDLSDINICPIDPHHGFTFLMGQNGQVSFTGMDVADLTGDECAEDLDIRIRKSSDDPYTESVTYTCDDIIDSTVFDVQIALFDFDGNLFSECDDSLLVFIDDYSSRVCPPAGSNINISGSIFTEERNAVENVQIALIGDDNQKFGEFTTSVDGSYVFNDMSSSNSYRLSTERNDEVINGVSTLDLLLIQRHILGLKEFDSPYKVIAADINKNGSVSASDLVQLRKIILGIDNTYPQNSSWRFIDAAQEFDDVLNPWPVNEVKSIRYSENNDFIGVKVGDVDLNAAANSLMTSSRSDDAASIVIQNAIIKDGTRSTISVHLLNGEKIAAFQLKLNIDPEKLKVNAIYNGSGNQLSVDEYTLDNGILTISRLKSRIDNSIVSLDITAIDNNVSISEAVQLETFDNEIYTREYQTIRINEIAFSDIFKQNVVNVTPNPFTEFTSLKIQSEKDQLATLRVFDIQGREVAQTKSIKLKRGWNEHIIRSSDLIGSAGIYIYSLQIEGTNMRGKLIYLD